MADQSIVPQSSQKSRISKTTSARCSITSPPRSINHHYPSPWNSSAWHKKSLEQGIVWKHFRTLDHLSRGPRPFPEKIFNRTDIPSSSNASATSERVCRCGHRPRVKRLLLSFNLIVPFSPPPLSGPLCTLNFPLVPSPNVSLSISLPLSLSLPRHRKWTHAWP